VSCQWSAPTGVRPERGVRPDEGPPRLPEGSARAPFGEGEWQRIGPSLPEGEASVSSGRLRDRSGGKGSPTALPQDPQVLDGLVELTVDGDVTDALDVGPE
jgi:hypothetical protein